MKQIMFILVIISMIFLSGCYQDDLRDNSLFITRNITNSYSNVTLPNGTSLDTLYLRLDTANDPLTGILNTGDINLTGALYFNGEQIYYDNILEFFTFTESITSTNDIYAQDVLYGDKVLGLSTVISNGDLIINGTGLVYNSTTGHLTTDGQVGIGTANPDTKLHLQSTASNTEIKLFADSGFDSSIRVQNADRRWDTFIDGSDSNKFKIKDVTAGKERFVIDSAGNVGIGTNSPETTLDIVGSRADQLRISDVVTDATRKIGYIQGRHFTNAEEDVAGIIIDSQSSTINFIDIGGGSGGLNSATEIKFYTAADATTTTGTERMSIESNGNVGIGTTSPDTLLHLSSGAPVIKLTDTDTNADSYISANSGAGSAWFGADEGNEVASSTIALRVDGAAVLTGINNGNVGVGTTNPIGKFNIEQGMTNYSESFISPHLLLSTTDTVDAIGFVGIGYESSITAYYGWTSGALRSSGGQSDFVWKFHSASDSGDERMRILSTGEVGIGTTTPAYPLEISTDNKGLGITDSGDSDNLRAYIGDSTGNGGYLNLYDDSEVANVLLRSYGDSYLNGGNLGIGTTNPNTKLEVNGIIKTTPRASATCDAGSEGGIYYDSDDNNFYGCNSTDWVQLNN